MHRAPGLKGPGSNPGATREHFWFPSHAPHENNCGSMDLEDAQDLTSPHLKGRADLFPSGPTGVAGGLRGCRWWCLAIGPTPAPTRAPTATAERQQEIHDMSEATKTQLRRTLYLTIMSSLDFEECAHKILKGPIPLDGKEVPAAPLQRPPSPAIHCHSRASGEQPTADSHRFTAFLCGPQSDGQSTTLTPS